MNYKEYKTIEQYFRLGEIIEKAKKKAQALSRIKKGMLSPNDLKIILEEIISLGVAGEDFIKLNELEDAITDEIAQLQDARKELKEIASQINIDIDKILTEKAEYERE